MYLLIKPYRANVEDMVSS